MLPVCIPACLSLISYTKLFTCDMGQLIPVMVDEVVPGDIFKIGNQSVIRMQPLVAPVLHEINAYVHYFFVPYRLLWDEWEDFITGGIDGEDTSTLPLWQPSVTTYIGVGSLWDYLGYVPDVIPTATSSPLMFPVPRIILYIMSFIVMKICRKLF